MKISYLLDQHQRYLQSEFILKQSLGDGFLFHNNRVYRNIRQAAVDEKFIYSQQQNRDYQALPLSQLESILSRKIIPFYDNTSVLEQLKVQLPDVQWHEVSDGLKKNYVFHESCHAVARAAATQFDFRTKDERVLQVLIEESFANTCELLAMIDAEEQVHKIFYEQNSYTALYESRTNFKNAAADIGEQRVAKFLLLSYLGANFLRKNLEEKQIYQMLDVSGAPALTEKQIKSLRALSKVAFTLDLRFRTVTTKFHLRLNNLETDIENSDFLQLLSGSNDFRELLNSIVSTAFSGP